MQGCPGPSDALCQVIKIEPKQGPGHGKRMKGLETRLLILVEGTGKDQDDDEGDRGENKEAGERR